MVTRLPLPLFAYLVEETESTVFLKFEQYLFLPVFTSVDNALLYACRAGFRCDLMRLAYDQEVSKFICAPPGQEVLEGQPFQIAIDPIAPDVHEFLVIEKDELLRAAAP